MLFCISQLLVFSNADKKKFDDKYRATFTIINLMLSVTGHNLTFILEFSFLSCNLEKYCRMQSRALTLYRHWHTHVRQNWNHADLNHALYQKPHFDMSTVALRCDLTTNVSTSRIKPYVSIYFVLRWLECF